MVVHRDADTVLVRYRYIDRNRGQRFESWFRIGSNGYPIAGENRPKNLDGSASGPIQRYEILGDSVRLTGFGPQGGSGAATQQDTSRAPTIRMVKHDPGTFYTVGQTPYESAALARFVFRQPGRKARMYPNNELTAQVTRELKVNTSRGKRKVRFITLHGSPGSVPSGIWLDDRENFFAEEVGWFMAITAGSEPALPTMRAAEIEYRHAEAEGLAQRMAPPQTSALVIKNGNVFDSEKAVVIPNTTVVIQGERITAVGPADSVKIPDGATVVDATGKTVIPGMVDMHGHLQLNTPLRSSVLQLAGGITSIRDLAADIDVAVAQRDLAAAGRILSPRLTLGGFLEGPGAWAGPTEAIAGNEAEARYWVARYDSLGYKQIKIYNLIHPDLVPLIVREAHQRRMRVSGHIPRGLTVQAALRLGFDEVNHAAFLFSTFFQDSLYVPSMRAYSRVASIVAPSFNVDGPEMTALIEDLKRHKTVIDGTFNIWQAGRAGAPAVSNYGRLVKRLYDAGITLVPGTDAGSVDAYLRELTLYEEDGIPAAKVLQIATLVPAQVMKEDKDYGSITVGKVADVVIVDGKPAERIADLQKVEQVVRAGRLYSTAALRALFPSRR
jgi:imidazolonepropionase-like amidohydrolase